MMVFVAGDLLRTVSIRLPKTLLQDFRLPQPMSFTPMCSTIAPIFSPSFRIAGTCAVTSRTRAPVKQWVPLVEVMWRWVLVSQQEAKQLLVEILETGGGGREEVLACGLVRAFLCWCTQSPSCVGAGVKETWDSRVLFAWSPCRETHGVEVVGVIVSRRKLTLDL